jgi:hypothetical protein
MGSCLASPTLPIAVASSFIRFSVFAQQAGRKVIHYTVNHRVSLSCSQRLLHMDEVEDERFWTT